MSMKTKNELSSTENYNKTQNMAKYTENNRNNDLEQWFNSLTPARRRFWGWLRDIDNKAISTSRNYVDYVGECNAYVRRFLSIEADFYELESSREVAQLKALLFSNSVFQLHASMMPSLKSALNKFSKYRESMENNKPQNIITPGWEG